MAELSHDPAYLERVRARDERVEAAAKILRDAETPIVADLVAAGVQVDSVWDLVNTATPYPLALPILMAHLERGGYPERVMESLGRALAVKPSIMYWDRLNGRWLHARDEGEEEGAALALAACATQAQVDELISFLGVEERGQSRIYFVRPILRLGGARGRRLIESLRSHPVLGKEATALTRRRRS